MCVFLMACHGQYVLGILLGKRVYVTHVRGTFRAGDIVCSIKARLPEKYSQTSNSAQIVAQSEHRLNEVENLVETESTLCVFMYQNV